MNDMTFLVIYSVTAFWTDVSTGESCISVKVPEKKLVEPVDAAKAGCIRR